jgi:hypothetical protein
VSRTDWLGWSLLLPLVVACGHDDGSGGPPPGEQTGQACSAPAQCYPGIDQTTLRGTVECLTNVQGGYCTHQCTADADCCAVAGECRTALVEVCSPFESLPGQRCFISCGAEDLARAQAQRVWGLSGDASETAYCQHFTGNPYFGCRSSGGGSAKRKICVP